MKRACVLTTFAGGGATLVVAPLRRDPITYGLSPDEFLDLWRSIEQAGRELGYTRPDPGPEYKILTTPERVGIECRNCGLVSYNQNDVAEKWCGFCRRTLRGEAA